jgi:hypothetical protein
VSRDAVYARWLRCRSLAWECVELVAARVETAAWERAHEALECSRIVESRLEEDA